MKLAVIVLLLAACSLTATQQPEVQNIPELQITVPYGIVNFILDKAVRLLDNNITNLLPFNLTLDLDLTIDLTVIKYYVIIPNLLVTDLYIGLQQPYFSGVGNNTLKIEICDVTLNATIPVTYQRGRQQQKQIDLYVQLQGVCIDISLQFYKNSTSPVGMGAILSNLNITFTQLQFFNNVTILIKNQQLIQSYLQNYLQNYLSNFPLIGKPILNKFFNRPLTLSFVFGQHKYLYQFVFSFPNALNITQSAIAIPISIVSLKNKNTTNLCPNFTRVELPWQSYTENPASEIQVLVGSAFTNQLVWLLYDANAFNLMIKSSETFHLTTYSLDVLIPSLQQIWPNQPACLYLQSIGDVSYIFFRAGRIEFGLNLTLSFLVNQTQSNHQAQQFSVFDLPFEYENLHKTQKTCGAQSLTAATLQTNLFIGLNLYNQEYPGGEYRLKGILSNLLFTNSHKVNAQDGVNLDSIALGGALNSVIGGLLPVLNTKLQEGKNVTEGILSYIDLVTLNGFEAITIGVNTNSVPHFINFWEQLQLSMNIQDIAFD